MREVAMLMRSAGAALLIAALSPFTLGSQPVWAEEVKVVGVYSAPTQQKWIAVLHGVLARAQKDGEINYTFAEGLGNPADYLRVLRQSASGGADLIIGEGFAISREARELAKQNPKTAFLMGDALKPQSPNYSVFDSWNQEGCYLMGIIAGRMTKTNKIGMVGGYPIPDVNRTFNAFIAGAKSVNPNAQFRVSYTSSWYDPPKEKEFALAQIDAGVDAIFAERAGVVAAARERHVLAFGIINDMNKLEDGKDVVVTSAVWHMDSALHHAIEAVKAHQYTAEDYRDWAMMAKGGTTLAPYYEFEDRIPPDVKAEVTRLTNEIVAGKYSVKIDDSEPKSSN
jgi:basic membrane protein A and related proteins